MCFTILRGLVVALTLLSSNALRLYQQMKHQWPRPIFPCSCCGGELRLCWGDVRQPYLRHVNLNDCAGGGEGAVHRLAKEGLATYLDDGRRVSITDGRHCSRCGEPHTDAVWVPAGGSVRVEHALADGGRADIAILDAAGEVETVIEIMDSHSTDSPRPEPWYEVKAHDVFKLLNSSAAKLGRNTVIEPAPPRLPPLQDQREDEGVSPRLWLHRKGIYPWGYTCEECSQRVAEERAAAEEQRAKRAKEEEAAKAKAKAREARQRDMRVTEAGRRPKAAYEKLRAEWDGKERKRASRERQFEMLEELMDALEEWWTAERKAGYMVDAHAAEGLWKQDHHVGVCDVGLVGDWEALGEETLQFGKYRGWTYMQMHGLWREESAAAETAFSYMSWAKSVPNPTGQLADLQTWLESDLDAHFFSFV